LAGFLNFIGGVEMPGSTATSDAVSAPLTERLFCSGFEHNDCRPLPQRLLAFGRSHDGKRPKLYRQEPRNNLFC